MFTTVLKELAAYFGKHWLVSALLPSLAFWSLGVLVFGIARGLAPSFQIWTNESVELQVTLAIAGVGWVLLFAYLIGNLETSLIRVFEGYWRGPHLRWLLDCRRRYYQTRFRFLVGQIEELTTRVYGPKNQSGANPQEGDIKGKLMSFEQERFLLFPFDEDYVMPTRLGNIMRASELYALARYGIDSVALWPRLYHFLPESFAGPLQHAKTKMVSMLVLCLLAFVFGLITCALLFFTNHWFLFLICALSFVLAWVFYLTALQGAILYAEFIKTAFDLHRWKLLEAMHIKLPTNHKEEWNIWQTVSRLIVRNIEPKQAKYENAPDSTLSDGLSVLSGFVQSIPAMVKATGSHAVAPGPEQQKAAQQPEQNGASTAKEPKDLFGYTYFGVPFALSLFLLFLMLVRPAHEVEVPVLVSDVSRYHLVTESDLKPKSVDSFLLSRDSVREKFEVLDHYTLEPIPADSVISGAQMRAVSDINRVANAVAVGIPASDAMVLGGSLRAGDVVDILMVRDAIAGQSSTPPAVLKNILVLDVKSVSKKSAALGNATEDPFVIVVALNQKESEEFAWSSAGANLTIARKP